MPTIHFLPFQKPGEADGRRTLLELARDLGLPLQAACGGKKICGRCRVIIEESREPLPPPAEREREALGELLQQGYRLACETVLTGEARVRIPDESQTRPPVVLTSDGFGELPVRLHPAVETYYLEVPPPILGRVTADRERLLEALEGVYGLKKVAIDPLVLPHLPQTLRAWENRVTAAVRNGREVVGLFPGREERLLGLAVDIGTTTLVAYLLDLQTGERLAVSSALNPQVHFGDDVITRIAFCQKDPNGSVQLREAVRAGINDLIGRAVEKAGSRTELILEAAVAGNTAMHHFFLGLETQYLARAPYPPVVQGSVFVKARDVGLAINPAGTVHLLPLKAGFVGSDIVAGLLATGLHKSPRVRLLIDLGTNGEIVLGNRDRLLCCSTAAGPAFEGGHIRWGMRASPGAIDRVRIDPESLEISLETIEDQPPQGLCGSGILSLVAEMIRRGILLAKGNFNPAINSPRLRAGRDGPELVLLRHWESLTEQEMVFTQKDAAEVQMAKAAIQAGVGLLEELFGNNPIGEILLAGAFGNYADPNDARTLGLIPASPATKVRGVGNAAGYGACLTLLDKDRAKEADRIARKLEYVELAGNSRFQDLLVDSLLFPGARDFQEFI
jgi:uncharacterized 2Fe-2S/4Fe-4S cluster protein (DUF4445 family)